MVNHLDKGCNNANSKVIILYYNTSSLHINLGSFVFLLSKSKYLSVQSNLHIINHINTINPRSSHVTPSNMS